MMCLQCNQSMPKRVSRKLLNSLSLLFRSCETATAAAATATATATAAAVNSQVKHDLNSKLLKVAMIGKTNAGKSTIINSILKLNVCDVSPKPHTTLMPLKAVFISDNSQIVFFDTPGLTSKKEVKKYNLKNKMPLWKKTVFEEADLVCGVHDVSSHPKFKLKLHPNMVDTLNNLPQQKTIVLIINKVDLIETKSQKYLLLKEVDELNQSFLKEGIIISNVFLTSAINFLDKGIVDFKNFLLEKAVPGEWLIKSGNVSDIPLTKIIKNLTRAQFLNNLREEVPYTCKYEVEYLEEDELGNYKCVILITCKKQNHVKIVLNPNLKLLKTVSDYLKNQLFFLTGKEFKLKIFVQWKKNDM